VNHHIKYTRFIPVFPQGSDDATVLRAQELQQSIGTLAAIEYMKSAGAEPELIRKALSL
jgi:hypothetical protein